MASETATNADLKREAPAVAAEAPEKVEPDAKRQKTDVAAPDAAALRKQVEYYLSDENLKFDKFFHEKMSAADGWLELAFILSSKKMQAMKATKETVLEALKESKIEVREDGTALRRPGNAVLPKLEERKQLSKKSSAHSHDGGLICVFKNIPEEQNWTVLKDKMKAKLPEKATVWFVSEVSEKRVCTMALSPFKDDLTFIETVELEVGGVKLQPEVCYGEALKQALTMVPKFTREKREKEARKRQKERNRPIIVGTHRFVNVTALRTRMREVLQARSDGEVLKKDGTDFKLVVALLQFHPKGAEKSKGLVDIKVAPSVQGTNRCFYMIREDGSEEDFSVKKCLDAIEANPPYVPAPAAAEKVEEKPAAAPKEEEKPAAAEKEEEKPAVNATPEEEKKE